MKAPLYAENAIPEYWIADVAAERIEAYRDPNEGRYRTVCIYERGESISPAAFPDLVLRVEELLP